MIILKISNEMVERVYEYSKMVYEKKITLAEAKERVNMETGMNQGSAQNHIIDFKCMMNGERYTRTINLYATEYFFKKIYEDYGCKLLNNAIVATKKHIDYYATKSASKKRSESKLNIVRYMEGKIRE